MKMTLRFLSKSFLFAAFGALAIVSQASAQQDMTFKATSIFGGAEFNNAANNIIVYNLPNAAVTGRFNVQAVIGGAGTRNVAGYGIIMDLPNVANGPRFSVPTLPESGTPNNLLDVISTPFQSPNVVQNQDLNDSVLGDTGVPGQASGDLSLGVVGLYLTQNANTAVANNAGLFSVPFTVPAGSTGSFALRLALGGNQYSGFAQNDGTILTPTGAFPQHNQTIVVRQSVRGDTDGSGVVDGEDIQPFVDALLDFNTFNASRPWLQTSYITDFDNNGAVDGEDIQPFVNALLGIGGSPAAASPAAVPEPSTVALGAIGFFALLAAKFRRRKA